MAVNTSEKEEANDENGCCPLWISPQKCARFGDPPSGGGRRRLT